MAHIKLKDLTVNSTIEADLFSDSDSFIRDLSNDELFLQGGRRHRPTPVLPPPEVSNNPTPVDPSFDFLPPFANFYI
jgi:hypothetical protein